MDCRYRGPAHETAVEGPGLLQGSQGMSPVPGPRVQGVHVHARGHPARAGRVPGGDAPTAGPGQDVWPLAPSNMWQAEHAAAMCRALQGQATALRRRRRRSRPATGLRPHLRCCTVGCGHGVGSLWRRAPLLSAACDDRGESTTLTVRPADLEAVQLGVMSGDGGTALYLQGTVVGLAAVHFRGHCGGDAFRLVMA